MKNTLKKRIISVLLTLSVLSGSSLFVFAQDDTTGVDEILSANDLLMESLDEEDAPLYVEDEVIVMLANTPETQAMTFKTLYSDNYAELNRDSAASRSESGSKDSYSVNAVGSADYITAELNLGIEISEMKMLNPKVEINEDFSLSSGLSGKTITANDVYQVNEEHNNTFSIKLEDISVGEAISILNQNPMIEAVEPNYIYELQAARYDSRQYALQHIEAFDAWINSSGANVAVGIIDTGIEGTHPALENNLWENPYYTEGVGCSVCSRSDDIHGYNFTGVGSETGLPCGGIPTDINGHGTHVSGIIAANSGIGTDPCGVAPNAKLVWLGCSSGDRGISNDAVIEAVNYADTHNIPIVNASIGTAKYSYIFENAINNYDGLFVTAAGNSNNNNDNKNIDETGWYPANYRCPNIIVVAASNKDKQLASYSKYGLLNVDVVAPGGEEPPENDPNDTNNVAILSSVLNGEYGPMAGTSMASPHVAGIAALIKSLRPYYGAQEIKAAICGTVQDSDAGYPVMYGNGIVSADDAVRVHPSLLRSVTFDYNYDQAPDDFIDYVVTGNKVAEPVNIPERSGWLFNGWSLSPNNGTIYDFDSVITTNTVLYAQWSEIIPGSYADVFPDSNFRNVVFIYLNPLVSSRRTSNSIVSESDFQLMRTITEINAEDESIDSLEGIQYFTGLTVLRCNNNRLTELDVSDLVSLKKLYCSLNSITSLNTSTLSELSFLDCSGNILTALDVSSNTKLTSINCSNNHITSLNVMSNSLLERLVCYRNNLVSLQAKNLEKINYIECQHNDLTSLDVSGSGVEKLYCSNNQIVELNVSGCTDIKQIACNLNEIFHLDLRGLRNIENINCQNNRLNSISDLLYDSDLTPTISYSPQKPVTGLPFTDVLSNKIAVDYVYSNGLMTGTSPTTFLPNVNLSRGEMANILYTMAGTPSVEGLLNPYTDVTLGYIDAVKWVYNNGDQTLFEGTSATTFAPNNNITREEAATAIYNYAQRNNITLQTIRDYVSFADESDISSDALESVKAVYRAKLMGEKSSTATGSFFDPDGTITRIETAVLIRWFELCRIYM